MTISISYAILTHNEMNEFHSLMEAIKPFVRDCDEIIVLDDYSDPHMIASIQNWNVKLLQRKLDGDFAGQRNYLTDQCGGDFIFMIDADEIPPKVLLEQLPSLVENMEERKIDACEIPRFNVVVQSIQTQGAHAFVISEDEIRSASPDFQTRLYRNHSNLLWKHRVHERLYGMKKITRLPAGVEYSLRHIKSSRRAKDQLSFYNSISGFRNSRIKILSGKIARKLGVRQFIRFIFGPRLVKFI